MLFRSEAVAVYLETNDLAKVAKVHEKIIRLYKTESLEYGKLLLQENIAYDTLLFIGKYIIFYTRQIAF